MTVEIREETADALPGYARVPIAFWVKSRFRVELVQSRLVSDKHIYERL